MFVSASTKGFKGGLAWIKPSKKDMAVTFSYLPPRKHNKTYVAQHKGFSPPLGEADADGNEDSSL